MRHGQQSSKLRNFYSLLRIVLAVCCMSAQIAAAATGGTSGNGKDSSCSNGVCTCTGGALPNGAGEDLVITTGTCVASAGLYQFRNVNIYGGGELMFTDNGDTTFWAASILIENHGKLTAGSSDVPYGANGTLTIYLYGKDQGVRGNGGAGITCKADNKNQCGVPDPVWTSNSTKKLNPTTCNLSSLPGGTFNSGQWSNPVSDCFYPYMPLDYDGGESGQPPAVGYFGYKVLAVSYGGTLQLFGAKGSITDNPLQHPEESGTSWARLTTPLAGNHNETSFTIDRQVSWKKDDQIVITTTDYLPGHSEVATLASDAVTQNGTTTITVKSPITNPHNGKTYSLDKIPSGRDLGPDTTEIETRAAVGLLTRSIRIVSAGDKLLQAFPPPPLPVIYDPYDCSKGDNPGYYFGAHTVFRQGFAEVQIRGAEFYQMGQGGRIMHYPVHFHMARKTPQPTSSGDPPLTFIEDSSVWDSMTRWMVLHATQGVTLARNVGYLSIGHGYYLEDATETNNRLYSNLGVFARAAVKNVQNPRQVPGIIAAAFPDPSKGLPEEAIPYHSDIDHPTVFWITNGWNDFQYNQAAGAGTCGTCYWLLAAENSGVSRYEKWWSYASEQQWKGDGLTANGNTLNRAGWTPLQKFKANACSTAMASFLTIGNTQPCGGVVPGNTPGLFPQLCPVTQGVLAPPQPYPGNFISIGADAYYPKVDSGGDHYPTQCPPGDMADCSAATVKSRCSSGDPACVATVLDHYTTSFNWAALNFAAVWLRPLWYLVSNSNITDVQAGGLTFVTGGGYTESDEIRGHWGIARNNAFVGHTQPPASAGGNPYASDAGPFNPDTGLTCALLSNGAPVGGVYCLSISEGISLALATFNGNQRLFNIYDGPAYQENNAYLDVTHTNIDYCNPGKCEGNGCTPGGCSKPALPYAQTFGMPADAKGQCYLPNAAIGWKQPNGFYYPPAFHSKNLFFDNVDIRHFVIEPLFHLGTYNTDFSQVAPRYCTSNATDGYTGLFNGFTDIDRQTELNDDDGSLTGLINTISVNKDPFFNAPVEDVECASDVPTNLPPDCSKSAPTCGTAKTSPYDFVTTVEYPNCGGPCPPAVNTFPCFENGKEVACPVPSPFHYWWNKTCSTPQCFGVPLYRQDLNPDEQGTQPFVRMAGQSVSQRSTLTVNHGTYYMDTTVSEDTQRQWVANQMAGPADVNVFKAGFTYYTFLLYAKPTTQQTYQMYVGTKDFHSDTDVVAVQAHTENDPVTFDESPFPPSGSSWTKSYDCDSNPNNCKGILTVTMDMDFGDFKSNYANAAEYNCQPATFCSWSGKACGCALNPADSLFSQCQAVCSQWTNKDAKCPITVKTVNGNKVYQTACYGFGVKFPNSFAATDQVGLKPASACYPKNDDWNMPFQPADPDLAGTCYYKKVPVGTFCPQ